MHQQQPCHERGGGGGLEGRTSSLAFAALSDGSPGIEVEKSQTLSLSKNNLKLALFRRAGKAKIRRDDGEGEEDSWNKFFCL